MNECPLIHSYVTIHIFSIKYHASWEEVNPNPDPNFSPNPNPNQEFQFWPHLTGEQTRDEPPDFHQTYHKAQETPWTWSHFKHSQYLQACNQSEAMWASDCDSDVTVPNPNPNPRVVV